MEVGNYRKPVEFAAKVLTTGKVKYVPIAFNPSLAELRALKDKGINVYVPNEEPVYFGSAPIDQSKPNELTGYFDATIYLRSTAFPDSIERVNYRVWNTGRMSSTKKYEVINAYGQMTWMEKEAVDAKKVPSNLNWFLEDGLKYVRRGEGQLVKFVRALRNLKNVDINTPKEEKEANRSHFNEDSIKKLMKGDFKNLRNVILEIPDAQVTFLTGIRTYEGKEYQDIFKDQPMKSYMADSTNSDAWLMKEITSALEAGRYASTDFKLDTGLDGKQHISGVAVNKPTDDPFASASNDLDFDSAPAMNFTQEDPDDLPF